MKKKILVVNHQMQLGGVCIAAKNFIENMKNDYEIEYMLAKPNGELDNRIPKEVKKRIDFYRARMLWRESQGVKKYHLVQWQKVCMPKDQGGLGVIDLEKMNIALLGKWIWKLENEEGIWHLAHSKECVLLLACTCCAILAISTYLLGICKN